MNITLQIMLNPATHDLSYDIDKEARRYRRGDIVAVYLTGQVGPPNPNTRLGFVHITDVPNVQLQKIKSILIAPVLDPLASDPREAGALRRRQWRIPASVLPVNARNQLITNREITITWEQAKPYVRKKLVSNRSDPSQDVETTELTDSDLS